jgi:membrane protease YdiL (CAAX protease family)
MTMDARADTRRDAADGLDEQDDDLGVAPEDRDHSPPVRSVKYSMMLLAMSVVWGILLHQFGTSPIYWIMGPYATLISATVLTMRGHALRRAMRPTLRNVGVGIGLGVLMTAATYPAYHLAQRLFPALAANVAQLYRQSHDESLPVALAWVVVIMSAEELLWRGAWVEALTARFGRTYAGVLSVLIYAATQLSSGSFIVCLLAVVCGAVWTAERYYTRSMIAPLLSHAIWTPTVILLLPVTQT